jgi:hypothetical protein
MFHPAKISTTVSTGSVKNLMKNSGSARGKRAGWGGILCRFKVLRSRATRNAHVPVLRTLETWFAESTRSSRFGLFPVGPAGPEACGPRGQWGGGHRGSCRSGALARPGPVGPKGNSPDRQIGVGDRAESREVRRTGTRGSLVTRGSHATRRGVRFRAANVPVRRTLELRFAESTRSSRFGLFPVGPAGPLRFGSLELVADTNGGTLVGAAGYL